MERKRVDYLGAFEVNKPVDVGWAIMILHDDHTVTRACKECGASARTPIDPLTGRVTEALMRHRVDCRTFDMLQENPLRNH